MKILKQLSEDVAYNMQNYSQLTIDLIQEAEDLYLYEYEVNFNDFGALAYKIYNVLEIIDKNRKSDIKALEMLYFILSNEVEGNKL